MNNPYKPSWEEFQEAYHTVMRYIDDEPNSRPVFHALLTFMLRKMKGHGVFEDE